MLCLLFTLKCKKGDWTIFAEYQYVDLDPSGATSSGVDVGIDFTDQLGELGIAYRVATFGINANWPYSTVYIYI